MGRRSANEGSIYKRKKDGLWVAQYLVNTPEGQTKRKYIYGKKRKDVADKLAEVQRERGYCRLVHGEQPEDRARARCVEHGDLYTRRPSPGLIHHSDRGSQYTSVEFSGRLKEAGLVPSMGSVADAYDNSMAESFISTLKRELIHRHSWPNRQTARTAFLQSTSRASTTLAGDTPCWAI